MRRQVSTLVALISTAIVASFVRGLVTTDLRIESPERAVAIFARGSDGGVPRLIGEDRIDHTPAAGKVSLTPGDAFDITVLRRQTDFKTTGLPEKTSESAWSIAVTNAKDRDVTVDLVEIIPGDWSILAESAPHTRTEANRVTWQLSVPAGREAQLSYRVRVQQ